MTAPITAESDWARVLYAIEQTVTQIGLLRETYEDLRAGDITELVQEPTMPTDPAKQRPSTDVDVEADEQNTVEQDAQVEDQRRFDEEADLEP